MDAEGLNLHYVTNVDVKMKGSHSKLYDIIPLNSFCWVHFQGCKIQFPFMIEVALNPHPSPRNPQKRFRHFAIYSSDEWQNV